MKKDGALLRGVAARDRLGADTARHNRGIPERLSSGSIGGLTAALLLRKIGCDVDVFERSSALLESRGAGIISQPIKPSLSHGIRRLTVPKVSRRTAG
jgi:hypothetical protein